MRYNEGGQKVQGGFYLDRNEWEMVAVSGSKGVLPGGPDRRFVKIPMLAVLVAAPVIGGAYVLFLPLIGFAILLDHLGKKAFEGVRRGASRVSHAFAR